MRGADGRAHGKNGSAPRALRALAFLAAVVLAASGCAAASRAAAPADQALGVFSAYDPGPQLYPELDRKSFYLTMPDKVKIAVDVYLPLGLPEGEKIPAILWQTRYWRGMRFTPAYSHWDRPRSIVTAFVSRGYAWVSVDVRGAGASFGRRPGPWSPEEISDGARVVDWITAQPWSNGRVGATGISYPGTCAEFLTVNRHPAVKASAPRFSMYDAYADIIAPGGLHLEWFTRAWRDYTRSLDQNELPERGKGGLDPNSQGVVTGGPPGGRRPGRRPAGPGLGGTPRQLRRSRILEPDHLQ